MMTRREGDWMVTTPIYVGMPEDIEIALACPHEQYEVIHDAKIDGTRECVFEKCVKCCARRVRYKTSKKGERDAERDDRCE